LTLLIDNDEVRAVLTMDVTMRALDEAYRRLAAGEAVCRPRIDIQIPTDDAHKTFRWGTMEGGEAGGYFAIRMKSDIVYREEYEGVRTEEKYCVRPGRFCGLILLFDTRNGEPLAIINDGYLQHMRVGADSGIGAKYMAREDARVVGMIGSGGMARSHVEAFVQVREIERVQVYSPTEIHREAYAREIGEKYDIETVPMATPEDAMKGADIVAGCTDAVGPVIFGEWLEEGAHVTCIGGKPDRAAIDRIDVALRLGNAPAPLGLSEFRLTDEHITYAAGAEPTKTGKKRGRGAIAADRSVLLSELLRDPARGRTSREQITFSERGNIQGAQFFAVAGKVYELAKTRNMGKTIPTDWLLQDIRD
jgi:ornithine cyclodeaminase/alanine dehydrogenase-like protein (mu-crystallin family)